MSKFKKLPIEIEAIQWKGTPKSLNEIKKLGDNGDILYNPLSNSLTIITLEGAMAAEIGDWIIEGIKKEIYPCKDTIFRETYRPSGKYLCQYCKYGELKHKHKGCDTPRHVQCDFKWKKDTTTPEALHDLD